MRQLRRLFTTVFLLLPVEQSGLAMCRGLLPQMQAKSRQCASPSPRLQPMPLERTAEHVLFCMVLVFRRGTAAESGDSSSFRRYVRLQHQVGAVVLVAIFAALALGLIGG